MPNRNKQIARRWHESWGRAERDAVEAECLAPDFQAQISGQDWLEREAYDAGVRSALGAFAGVSARVDEAAAEGRLVMSHLTWRIAARGPAPTREMSGVAIDRFEDGRIVEHRLVLDRVTAAREPAFAPVGRERAREHGDPVQPAERLPLRSNGRVRFVRTGEIEWVDAAHNYVRIHTVDGTTHVTRSAIGALESRLDPQRFLRVHRSTIVNAECVRELELSSYGNYVAILTSGQRVSVSRSFKSRLPALLGA